MSNYDDSYPRAVEPTNIRFGGGASDTILHPIVALLLVIAVVLTLFSPRQKVAVPWLAAILLIPLGQVVVLGGVHFSAYRILVIVGLIRLAVVRLRNQGLRLTGGFGPIDKAFTLYSVFAFATFSVQWLETQAVIRSLGTLLDGLGAYFILRFLIRDAADVKRAIKTLAVLALILAACMINERATQRNVFGLLGGVPLNVPVRDGSARAMGPFEVYITAGVFGATLIPLFVWLCSERKTRLIGIAGLIGATAITVAANSSTPLLAYVGGIAGLLFWPFRRRMRLFRWSVVIVLTLLHLLMKAPVWALIARIDLTGSSSGFHRYMLVDQCIRHFGDWWLVGVKNYNDWGFDMWDLSNQYVQNAVTGGLATLAAFILLLSRSFGRLGRARRLVEGNPKREWAIWCLCSALVGHVVAYLGISYFDQVQISWYALLAVVVVSISEAAATRKPANSCEVALPQLTDTELAPSYTLTAV